MSLWFIAAYVKDLRGFNSAEKAVLFVLAEYYNRQQRVAWPEQATLAAAAGMSERTLIRVLQSLEAARPGHPHGILRRSQRHAGRGSVTNYHFVEFEQKDDKIGDAKGDNLSPVMRNNDQTIKPRTLPNPPLLGGNLRFKLSRRDHTRIATWIEKQDRPNDIGVGKLHGKDWAEVVRLACLDLMIPLEEATHDLLLMDENAWSARLELRKPAHGVTA